MKPIKKVAVTPIKEIYGSIVDGTNIDDKEHNTYSANTIDGLINDDGYVMGQEYTAYCTMSTKAYYNTYRGFIPLRNAHKYNITITGFRVEKDTGTVDIMSSIDLSSIDQKYETGFTVSNSSSNASGGWCRIKFTLSKS